MQCVMGVTYCIVETLATKHLLGLFAHAFHRMAHRTPFAWKDFVMWCAVEALVSGSLCYHQAGSKQMYVERLEPVISIANP
eukprot:2860797-Amphidinium_carterae.1